MDAAKLQSYSLGYGVGVLVRKLWEVFRSAPAALAITTVCGRVGGFVNRTCCWENRSDG